MYSNAATEQFAEINKTNVEQATKLAAVALQNAEKIFNANLEAAKFALAQGAESAAAVAKVKDVQEFLALPAKYAEFGVQGALGYSRNLYEIASETQAQFSAVAEETFAVYTKGFASWVDKAGENAPAGSDVAVNALKSGFAATSAAFDQFQKATKQVVSLADASVRAAAANAANVANVARANGKGRKAAA
ncbi:MAG TPA: phasin family protein [Casimicrobiaceae bacterium]|nr:phasin family protein [Casimicrobiaceae bacterium]